MAYMIDGKTKLTALLGHPVEHSLSPAMHNTAFAELDLPFCYLAFDVEADGLSRAVDGLCALGARGFNLTMPHKNEMAALCTRLSPVASVIGAVNTVVIEEDGTLSGHTTDGAGFFRAAREAGVQIRGEKMVLFGAGGAAGAILAQAAFDGAAEVTVFSRPTSRFADRLVGICDRIMEETDCRIRICAYEDDLLRSELADSRLLVNATNVGMAPNTDACLVPDASFLPEGLAVADCIYHPEETRLLSMAAARGCTVIKGLPMLLYQGAEAFRLWTGQDMPVEHVRQVVFND